MWKRQVCELGMCSGSGYLLKRYRIRHNTPLSLYGYSLY